jgi:hypothetical protein
MIDPLYSFIALFLLLFFLYGRFRKDISIDWMNTYLSMAHTGESLKRTDIRRNNNERQPNCIRQVSLWPSKCKCLPGIQNAC